jgi:hypothetical protein
LAGRVQARLSPGEGRKFGLTVGIAFWVLTAVLAWRGRTIAMWIMGSVGTALLFAGLVLPAYLGPVQRAWMGLAHAISRVTTPIFLGVTYFLVLGPVGLGMRLFGRNPLVHTPERDSYWVHRRGDDGRGTMKQKF